VFTYFSVFNQTSIQHLSQNKSSHFFSRKRILDKIGKKIERLVKRKFYRNLEIGVHETIEPFCQLIL